MYDVYIPAGGNSPVATAIIVLAVVTGFGSVIAAIVGVLTIENGLSYALWSAVVVVCVDRELRALMLQALGVAPHQLRG